MYKEYLYRYMDITRCDVINSEDTCPSCGHKVEFRQNTNFDMGKVKEEVVCRFCRTYSIETFYVLQ